MPWNFDEAGSDCDKGLLNNCWGLKIGHNFRKSMPECNNNSQGLELSMVRISFVLDSSFLRSFCVARALLLYISCIQKYRNYIEAKQKINRNDKHTAKVVWTKDDRILKIYALLIYTASLFAHVPLGFNLRQTKAPIDSVVQFVFRSQATISSARYLLRSRLSCHLHQSRDDKESRLKFCSYHWHWQLP